MKLVFLQDYRGVLSGEIFYAEGQEVEVDGALQPLDVDELIAAGRVEVVADVPAPKKAKKKVEKEPEPELEAEPVVEAEPKANKISGTGK